MATAVIYTRVSTAEQAVERDATAEVARLRTRRARLLEAFLAGALDRASFQERDNDLAMRIQVAEGLSRDKTDWSLDVESAISRCVLLLDDPVSVWESLNVADGQQFAKCLFGDHLTLKASGECRTARNGGLAGAICQWSEVDGTMARPRRELSNLILALEAMAAVAA